MLVIANLDHIKNVVLFSDYLLIVSPTWTLGFFHSEIPSTKIVADWACCERRNKTRKIGSMDEMSSFMNWNDELMKWNDEEGWLNQKGLWLLCTCNGSVKGFKRKREFWKLKNVLSFFLFLRGDPANCQTLFEWMTDNGYGRLCDFIYFKQ